MKPRYFLLLLATWASYLIGVAELPANTWTQREPSGITPEMLGWETLIYVPIVDRCVVYGNYKTFSSENQHVLLSYDFASNHWSICDFSTYLGSELLPSAGHDFSKAAVDQRRGIFVLGRISTVWPPYGAVDYDLLARCGRNTDGPGNPPFDGDASGVAYSPHGGIMLNVHHRQNRTVAYHPASRESQDLADFPGGRRKYSRIAYDPRGKKFYLFGGLKDKRWHNDLWSFDPGNGSWKQVAAQGDVPPAPHGVPQLLYNDRYGVLMLFTWVDDDLGPLYVFDPATTNWSQEDVAGAVPFGGDIHALRTAYDSRHDVVITSGGERYKKSTWAFRYLPQRRQALAPLDLLPTARRMEPGLSSGRERWHDARLLNADADKVTLGTTVATHENRAYVAWSEDNATVYVREGDGRQ